MDTYEDIVSKIKELRKSGIPFVAFRKPFSNTVKLIFQSDTHCHLFNYSFDIEGFVLAPFENEENPTVIIKSENEMEATCISVENFSSSIVPIHYSIDEMENYKKLVRKAVSDIGKGKFEKVVLSRQITISKPAQIIDSFSCILTKYSNAFCFLFSHPEIGTWIAATPETLFNYDDGILKTMSLAGTQPYVKDKKIVWTQKEKKEQQIVTDTIIKKIQPYTTKLIVSKTKTIQIANIAHLQTNIQASILNSEKVFSVLYDLHPTPAVCGYPTEIAKKFIIENEGYSRSYYTGFCGIISKTPKKNIDFYVNLRCLQTTEKQTYIYVGGGIVNESDADSEWKETENKAMTMYSIL